MENELDIKLAKAADLKAVNDRVTEIEEMLYDVFGRDILVFMLKRDVSSFDFVIEKADGLGITGAVLNEAFELDNDDLAACGTLADILADNDLAVALIANADLLAALLNNADAAAALLNNVDMAAVLLGNADIRNVIFYSETAMAALAASMTALRICADSLEIMTDLNTAANDATKVAQEALYNSSLRTSATRSLYCASNFGATSGPLAMGKGIIIRCQGGIGGSTVAYWTGTGTIPSTTIGSILKTTTISGQAYHSAAIRYCAILATNPTASKQESLASSQAFTATVYYIPIS